MAVNEAFKRPLAHYVKCLEDMHDKVVNLKEETYLDKHAFSKAIIKVKIDTEEILKLNRDIRDQHRQFMEALGLFTAWRIQSVERNTKVIKAALSHQGKHENRPDRRPSSWAGDITSDKPIFWLCDIAGSGKSTVAMSAADAWKKEEC
ncbi:SubName: Full=Uncharacterized protein {ECO:0000313/EMBL:CCA77125.1}; Flags: Fragment [Serendipita indica DSM 11827]|nr:SubName: Full=Uncharacterized protein {ECO:0000313/EMBL:CCA77125.1}; Flags: Fragment [Serendipita indica DSM 11827]